ncbi:PACE efflux transporter [Rhizobium sp. SYY.PMSO]|uniref:PACE efflux transporter n=1 Tax=Rhizobium sp. SYY.PMSO TaxID=3382192 RepID=UPI00398F8F83
MRTFKDRVRHAVMFELIGLAVFTPGAALLFDQPIEHMGIVGIISATAATIWNFLFNIGFDKAMLHGRGSLQKTIPIRIAHTALFEAGLIVMLIPFVAWYLGISLMAALAMDVAIVGFYLVYAFVFNIAHDRAFPIGRKPLPRAS